MRDVKEKLIKNIANKVGDIAENGVAANPLGFSPFLFGHEISLEEDNQEENSDITDIKL